MQIRDIIDLVEGLLAEGFKLAYQHGYRSWYHPQTKTWHDVPSLGFGSHGREVFKNPEMFGVDPTEAKALNPQQTHDEQILTDLAIANGWVRIAGESRNNPDKGMIFEGDDVQTLRRVAKMFVMDMGGELQSAMLKCHGEEYVMIGVDKVKAGILRGELPPPVRKAAAAVA